MTKLQETKSEFFLLDIREDKENIENSFINVLGISKDSNTITKLSYRIYEYKGEEDYNPYGGHQLSYGYVDEDGFLQFKSPSSVGSNVSEEEFLEYLEEARTLDFWGFHYNKIKEASEREIVEEISDYVYTKEEEALFAGIVEAFGDL